MTQEKTLNDFDVSIDPQAPLFVIGVASVMVGVPIWTLRKLDEMDVVRPQRVGVRTRCYSQAQIRRLVYVKYLMEEQHVNISGVKMILKMRSEGT